MFHGLHFSSHSSLELRTYFDVDWAGDPTDRRSTTGYCFLLGTSLISWRSKKQSVVARSSTETEYRALADTTSELLWLRWLLSDMGVPQSTSSPIHCDNQSAIQIAIMMFSMSAQNISRLTVISSDIIFSMVFYIFIPSPLQINWRIFLSNLIHWDDSMILSPNSSWLRPLEFEGGC
jgi:hypothetical protein